MATLISQFFAGMYRRVWYRCVCLTESPYDPVRVNVSLTERLAQFNQYRGE